MKTTLRFMGLNDQVAWRRLVDQQINHLQTLTLMTAAKVVLVKGARRVLPLRRLGKAIPIAGPDEETSQQTKETNHP